jgi:rod shape-determining protein MreC
MKNLLRFIIRFNFFFLFLLLETVALVLVFRHQNFQRAVFANSSSFLVGSIYEIRSGFSEYFSLKKVNQQLAAENALLLKQNQVSLLLSDDSVFEYQDTILQQKFEYVNAGVINNTLNRRNNFITLDKGSIHGIKPNMGVLTLSGPVGIVVNVSSNFSTVISVLNTDFQASVRIKRNDHVGSLLWNGNSHRFAEVAYIPGHVDLQIGDTIITSGLSTIFPPNISVGIIKDFEMQMGGNYFSARIELSQDFNKLRYVKVVRNLFLDEQIELEGTN